MKPFFKYGLIVATVIFLFSGCKKKYPEGPLISFKSKTERVVNEWIIVQVLKNGEDVTSDEVDEFYEFKDNYTGKYTKITHTAIGDIKTTDDFEWDFNKDRTKIIIDYDDYDYASVFTILKLYEKEMWWTDEVGDDKYEFHLEPAEN